MNARRASALLAVAVAAVAAAAQGEYAVNYAKVDTSRWNCRLCALDRATASRASISAGALHSARGEARFGRDNGIDQADGLLHLTGDYRVATQRGVVFQANGRDLGLPAREARVEFRRSGRYGVAVRHRQLPRNVATDARTPFRLGEVLRLPADWARAFDTGGMTALATALRPLALATERRRSEATLWFRPTAKTTWSADYFHESKTGVAQTSRDAFYQAAALPQAVDQIAQGWRGGWRYEGEAGLLAAEYRNQRFENLVPALAWENPYASGPATLQSATAPSNHAESARLLSRLRLGKHTVLNASFTAGETRQNAPFLRYSTNDRIGVSPIGAEGLDGRRSSRRHSLRVVSRLTRRLAVTLTRERSDRRNARAPLLLTPVLGDLVATPQRAAFAYAFRRERTELRARYRAPGGVRLAAGLGEWRFERSPAEVEANTERRVWVQVRRDFAAGWQMSASAETAHRAASLFTPQSANNPLTRRFHQAARDETAWQAALRYDSPTSGFAAGVGASRRALDYPRSALGLHSDASFGWHADLSYSGGRGSAHAFHDTRRRRAVTLGRALFDSLDWRYDTSDRVTSSGARLHLPGLWHPALDVTLNFLRSHGLGAYTTTFAGERDAFPLLASSHRAMDVRLRYEFSAGLALTARVYEEAYRAADWAIDGVEPDHIRNVLTLGRSSPRYRNRVVAVSVERKRRWESRESSGW